MFWTLILGPGQAGQWEGAGLLMGSRRGTISASRGGGWPTPGPVAEELKWGFREGAVGQMGLPLG